MNYIVFVSKYFSEQNENRLDIFQYEKFARKCFPIFIDRNTNWFNKFDVYNIIGRQKC